NNDGRVCEVFSSVQYPASNWLSPLPGALGLTAVFRSGKSLFHPLIILIKADNVNLPTLTSLLKPNLNRGCPPDPIIIRSFASILPSALRSFNRTYPGWYPEGMSSPD